MPKKWPNSEVPGLVDRIYIRVLERGKDDSGLITYGSALERGEQSVRDTVRLIALSEEHTNRFITPHNAREAVGICYRHILARDADSGGLNTYVHVFETEGIDNVINDLINSEEYANRFGDDGVPS